MASRRGSAQRMMLLGLVGLLGLAQAQDACAPPAKTTVTTESCYNKTGACIKFDGAVDCKTMDRFMTCYTVSPCNAIQGYVDISGNITVDLRKHLIQQVGPFTYPTSSRTQQAYWMGGSFTTGKDDFYSSVEFDASVFATPPNIQAFGISHLDLGDDKMEKIRFSPQWGSITLRNLNLAKVPVQFKDLTGVSVLDMSMNRLTKFPEYPAWDTITYLNLAENSFTTFPPAIFGLKNLRILNISHCNFTNVALSPTHARFLTKLPNFTAEFTITKCPSGYENQALKGELRACISSEDGPDSPGSGSASLSGKTEAANDKNFFQQWGWIVLVVAVVVIVLGYIFMRRKHQDNPNDGSTKGTSGKYYSSTQNPSDRPMTPTSTIVDIWTDPQLLEARIEFNALSMIHVIAQGSFGEVWFGNYDGRDVVIKQMRNDKNSSQYAMSFVDEIKLMARLDHPKIVTFIGVAWHSMQTLLAVIEYMPGGDLCSFLASERSQYTTWEQNKGTIAIDIAEALVYLHSLDPCVIHRDLKSRNVMLDNDLNAKLTDFGISRQEDLDNTMTACIGTARWMAPEVISGGRYTESADIYSFGVVLTELDTHKLPFFNARNYRGTLMDDVEIVQMVANGELHPMFSPACPSSIIQLGMQCLNPDPNARPSAMQVSYFLRKALGLMRSDQSYLDGMTMNL